MRTVINGSASLGAVRAKAGYQLVMTGNRPAHLHWGTCGNSTVVWAALNKLPFAIGFTNNMSYRYTMCHHLFQHFLLRARRIKRKISVQNLWINVLMVHHQQPFFRGGATFFHIYGKEMHAIVMRTNLPRLI